MKTFAKVYVIIEGDATPKVLIDIPLSSDFFFPFGIPNNHHILKNGYEVFNKDFLEPYKDNLMDINHKVVFGKSHFYTCNETYNQKRAFIVEEIMTQEEYRERYE